MEKKTSVTCENARCLNNRRGRCFASEIQIDKKGECLDNIGAEILMCTNKKGEEQDGI